MVRASSLWIHLSRRESQIMDVLHHLRRGTVEQVQDGIEDAPSYHSVRVLLRVLEGKGHVGHEREGRRYVYFPVEAHETAKWSALNHLKSTFFGESTPEIVSTLLGDETLSSRDLDQIAEMIERVRHERRSKP